MKKLFFIALVITGLAATTNAQSTDQGGAGRQFNFGGIGTGLYASYDFPVAKNITVSPIAKTNWDFDWMVIGGKGDYYFDSLLKLPAAWDVYAGVNLGFALINDNGNDNLDFGAQVGGRWWFSDKWAINAEFGGGKVATGGIGVSVRL
ncbi:hypothetical protein [Saccharicrinis aurantiacus]|uniref:hypothetical protein n=1 Tax=Saccharicrinis aurantiacus TaxID=1849719 RepID=UPI0024925922|nr:hypothetical protein [Saccharicrinis aurantiacus]